MKSFYGKYIANAFGILSSTSSVLYLLLIFFGGVNTLLIPPMFLIGNKANAPLISLTSQIMHILSVAFLFLFYSKYFSKDNTDKLKKTIAIVFSSITVVFTIFSYDIEHLFLLTSLNGVLLSVFMFIVCLGDFYYVSERNSPLIKISRIIMSLSVFVALLFIFSASTYYELTAAIMRVALGKFLSVRKNYALSFLFYSLGCILQIAEFAFLYVAENHLEKQYKERK